jgi:broad specificity phosphatase PhoE/adenylate kinase family enzyme
MKLYLVRHPQTNENVAGIIDNPLKGSVSKKGFWQADRLEKRLSQESIDNIISSDSDRCYALCNVLTSHKPRSIEYSQLLRERNPGVLIGKKKEELNKLGLYDAPSEGESYTEVRQRVIQLLKNVESKDNNTLIVSHAYFIKTLLSVALNIDPEKALSVFKISNCALTILNHKSGKYEIDTLNNRDFLKEVKRIAIIGSYGAGKTSLANTLSEKHNIPAFSMDDLKYERKFDKIRDVSQRLQMLKEICGGDKWIIEGSWTTYAAPTYERSDLLILLNPGFKKCIAHSVIRQFRRQEKYVGDGIRKLGTLLMEIMKYHFSDQLVSLNRHKKLLAANHAKSIAIKSPQEILRCEFLEDLLI